MSETHQRLRWPMTETRHMPALLAQSQSITLRRAMRARGKSGAWGSRRRLLAASTVAGLLLGAIALVASEPADAQVPVLPNGALDTRRPSSGYDFYFGSADQGRYDDGELHAWRVQGNVWLIAGQPDQANTVVQIGNNGVLVVDTGTTEMAPKLLALIQELAGKYGGKHKDIRWIINTDGQMDHIGGNEILRRSGTGYSAVAFTRVTSAPPGATVVASLNMSMNLLPSRNDGKVVPEGLWPSELHDQPVYSWYFNDEAVALHLPANANTNGNMMVRFLRSDVIATGDIVSQTTYPIIDQKHGGTIDGVLTALNQALEMSNISSHNGLAEGGTLLIPGHGRMIDRTELLSYIIMVTKLRNQIMYYKNSGRTLQEVLAMNVTSPYDGRWSPNGSKWTGQDFVKAVYNTLPPKGRGANRFSIKESK